MGCGVGEGERGLKNWLVALLQNFHSGAFRDLFSFLSLTLCLFLQMKKMPASCANAFQTAPVGFAAWHWMKVQRVSVTIKNDSTETRVLG